MKEEVIYKVINRLRFEPSRNRVNTGYSGGFGDGGAGLIEMETEFYLAGFEKRIPKSWEGLYQVCEHSYNEEVRIKSDPEYKEYVRLKEKFKDR